MLLPPSQSPEPADALPAAEWLRAEYTRRRGANSLYSLRAFARDLALPSGRLSELLTYKRALTPDLGKQLAARLRLSARERGRFLKAVRSQRQTRTVFRRVGSQESKAAEGYSTLSFDSYHAIADWHHFAILSLIKTVDFRPEAEWIASRLGITEAQATESTQRLFRLGLLEERSGKWARTREKLTTTHDVQSAGLRRAHGQRLRQAIQALEETPLELRDITSVTFPADPSSLPLAKKLIKEFRRALSDLLEEGRSTEVYHLTVALVPATRNRGGK